jgi:hypothetical protein
MDILEEKSEDLKAKTIDALNQTKSDFWSG